jgi:predicted DsbA family dithiol-disulfide isomerase
MAREFLFAPTAVATSAALFALAAALAAGAELQPATLDGPASSGRTVIATVGGERITAADVAAADRADFDRLESDYQLKLRQLHVRQSEARYELLQQHLERSLDARALALEAKARGVKPDAILAAITVPVVTDDEVREFYEANKARAKDPFETLRPKIAQYLANQHDEDARRSFYDGLRARHGITSLLGPYRVTVAATGPARGKGDAPVTIVEFGDFQCPFCREAEGSLRAVMSKYPGQVRLVFRNLPLANLHPNATAAAVAGVCAEHQGMFWQMHDAMYQDQSALTESALKDTAQRLGLKMDGFSACLADPGTKQELETDREAADELNVTGTPYFFINGRPLNGSVPVERFEAVITDELHRLASKPDEMKRG